ncbi:MAG: hypothetical protein V7L29_25955 [Nostoc sp.]|uniref:hypothetical protein n=1 Tax=Nostoc sp. TaxID=1180 RepID=UPI002FF85493
MDRSSPRISSQTCSTCSARKTAACPAEFASPTTTPPANHCTFALRLWLLHSRRLHRQSDRVPRCSACGIQLPWQSKHISLQPAHRYPDAARQCHSRTPV